MDKLRPTEMFSTSFRSDTDAPANPWISGSNARRGRRTRSLAALVACAGIGWTFAACDDPTGPDPAEVAGTYDLVDYQGKAVPAEIGTFTIVDSGNTIECTVVLESGSLELQADARYTLRHSQQTQCENGAVAVDGKQEGGTFSLVRNEIIFVFDDALLGLTTRTADRDGDRVIFRQADSNVQTIFERPAG